MVVPTGDDIKNSYTVHQIGIRYFVLGIKYEFTRIACDT
jgi:hypothetical protein